jgi:6-phosphogluconolactonase
MTRYLYVGTSTHEKGQNRAEGIYVYRMDPTSGKLERVHAIPTGPNPSFLVFDPTRRFLFSVNETFGGGASAYAVDPATGGVTLLNQVSVAGDLPCYISIDPSGRYLLVACYWSGSLTVVPVGADGRLGERSQVVHHLGAAAEPGRRMASYDATAGLLCEVTLPERGVPAGVKLDRQETAHAHSILFDPGQQFALSADLGMDRVWIYRFENGRLAANCPGDPVGCAEQGWVGSEAAPAEAQATAGHNLKPGAGPRHIAFHPNQRFAYVSNELDSTVTAFAWDGSLGALRPVQNLSTLPADFHGKSDAAHLAITPDGRFLYVSNRGHNSLAIYRVDAETGLLTSTGFASCLGNWPRNFCIDPDGRFLVVANQYSEDVFVMAIDPNNGALKPTGERFNLPAPLFVTVVDL